MMIADLVVLGRWWKRHRLAGQEFIETRVYEAVWRLVKEEGLTWLDANKAINPSFSASSGPARNQIPLDPRYEA